MKIVAILIILSSTSNGTPLNNNIFGKQIEDETFTASPFSVAVSLIFVQSGGRGPTVEEIRKTFLIPDDENEIEADMKSLLENFKDNGNYSLHISNGLYRGNNFTIKNNFKNVSSVVYKADQESVDFRKNVEAARVINEWVEKQTSDKIKNLIDYKELGTDTRAVVINNIYFKANWSGGGGKEIDSDRKYVEFPLQGGEAVLILLFPRDCGDQLHNKVSRPRFKIRTTINFRPGLEKLGIRSIFDAKRVDLSGIGGNKGDLVLDNVSQEVYIDVGEEGVEAGVATYNTIDAPVKSDPEFWKVSERSCPFSFFLKIKDYIVFTGRIDDSF